MGKYTDDRFKQYIKEFNRVLKEMEKEALFMPTPNKENIDFRLATLLVILFVFIGVLIFN
jgi:hypothetical protein